MMQGKIFAVAGAALLAAGVTAGASSFVQAQPGVQLADAAQMAAVKDRQELMKSIGGNMKTVADFLKGEGGTSDEAMAAASKINELAATIPSAFQMEASLDEMDAVGKNRGKPEIWLNWDGFVDAAETLEDTSATLVSAFQGGDNGAIQEAFGNMGKNGCGGCHNDFRGPKVE